MKKSWYWRDALHVGKEASQLVDARGRVRCTVWSNGTWHTWDENGVGGENDTARSVDEAKEQATRAVIRQRWACLVSAPKPRKQAVASGRARHVRTDTGSWCPAPENTDVSR